MPSIIIAAFPAHGHVTPLLTVARGFVERGDDVRFITGAAFADRLTATGARHTALPPEADFDVEHRFANPAKPQYEAVMAAHAVQAAHVVLADPGFFGGALLLAHRRPMRPAVVMCGVAPLVIHSRDTAPYGMGLAPVRLFNH